MTRLNPGLRYRHWAGFRSCTHSFELAAPYVFSKQPGPPCHCDLPLEPFDPNGRHPFYQRYGANLPISLARHTSIDLRLLTLGTCVGSGYGHRRRLRLLPFHGLRDSAEAAHAAHSRVPPGLTITVLPGFRRLDGAEAPLSLSRSVRRWRFHRKTDGRVVNGTGILTGFPFARAC